MHQTATIQQIIAKAKLALTMSIFEAIASNSDDTADNSKVTSQSLISKVVAIPFPIAPRHVLYGPLAKVINFKAKEESRNVDNSSDTKKST
ncbi:MAG TPA: hypothetical protein VJZ26_06565 [Blastocatellia bacterium]|nr:hypothetical protein [Blastocatellia bacterium]